MSPALDTPESLLQYDGFVRRLARSLAAQDSDAEDLAQQTFAAALCAEPGVVHSTRAWLGTLVRNLASNMRRSKARRQERERAAAQVERTPSSDEILAREEARRDVVTQVLALEPAQREVVVLRYFEDLPPRVIARRLALPVETVKTRLKRALAQLRSRMAQGHSWPAVLWFAGQPLAPAAGAGFVSWSWVLVMSTKAKFVLLAASLVAILWAGKLATELGRVPIEEPAPAAQGATAPPVTDSAPSSVAQPPVARTAVVEAPKTSAGDTIEVTVIDAASLLPVAGAEVMAQRLDDPARPEQFEDHEAQVRRVGIHRRTDARGVARVPRPPDHTYVVARSGHLYGESSYNPDYRGAQIRILMEEDTTLRVRVVSAAGEPVPGVEVELRVTYALADPSERSLGTSGRDGMCVLPHAQNLLRVHESVSGPAVTASVAPRLPGIAANGIAVDLRHPPREPVLLTAADGGRVAVELEGLDGEPSPVAPVITCVEDPRQYIRVERQGARHVTGPVALGRTFRCQMVLNPGTMPPMELPGPTRPGEEVVFRVPLDPARPRLLGRLVDAQGAPLAGRRFQLLLKLADTRRVWPVATDDAGRFTYPLGDLLGKHLRVVHLVPSAEDGEGLMARAEPARRIEAGKLDLGDLVLTGAPLVARGKVLGGPPVPRSTQFQVVLARELTAPRPDSEAWLRLEVRTRWLTGHDFELRGHAPDEALALIAPPAPAQRFHPDATDLQVVRRRSSIVAAQVRHDLPPPLRYQLHAALVAIGPGDRPVLHGSSSSPLAADEYGVRFDEVPAGQYRLRVHVRGDREPLAEIGGIVIDEAPTAATIVPVDVRGRVRLVRLRAVDGSGAPVKTRATLVLTDNSILALPIGLHDSVFTVPVGRVPPDAIVRADGYRDQEVRAIAADADLVLVGSRPLRVRVQGADAVPAGVQLHAFLAPHPQTHNMFSTALGPMHGSGQAAVSRPTPGEFVFLTSRPGAHRVTLVLQGERDPRAAAVLGEPWPVEVAASGSESLVDLRLDPTLVDACLRALGR